MKKRIISAAILPLLIASLAACSSTSSVAPTTDAPTTSETPTSETPVTSETPSSSEEPEPEPAPEPAVESITAADLHTAEILPNYVVSLTVRVDKILDTEESVKGSFLAADPFDGAPIVVAHSSLDASVLELTDKEDGTYKGTFDKSSDKLGLSITVGEGDAAVTTKVEAGDIVTITGVATIVAGVDGKSCIGLNGVIDAASIQKSEFLTYRHKVNVSVVDEAGAPTDAAVVNYIESEDLTSNGYILWGKAGKFSLTCAEGAAIDYNATTVSVVAYDGTVSKLSKKDMNVDGERVSYFEVTGAAYLDVVVKVSVFNYSAPLTEALNSDFADGAKNAGSSYGARNDVKLGNMVYDFSVCSYQSSWGTKGIAVGSNESNISKYGEIDAALKAPIATQLGEEKAASLTMKRDLTNVTSLTVNVLPEYTDSKGKLKNAGEARYCTAFLLESTDGGTTWALVSTREASASKKNTTTVWTYTPEAAVAKARYAVVVRMDYKKDGKLANNRFCITSITSTVAA
ncbi:MAG: hypothetical protein SPK92_03435 [Bacilli bacterium]|nr:hypothetical protein [Bacilli bacterium]MDY5745395.1 hypothetical protein [Bacilli bacterium]